MYSEGLDEDGDYLAEEVSKFFKVDASYNKNDDSLLVKGESCDIDNLTSYL